MQAERSKYLQAGEYERTEERKGYANGYKPKTVRTRVGEITFAIPASPREWLLPFGAGKRVAQ
jgi:putative transposase